jgi:4-nitrophenyl phosphatase
MKNNFNLNDIQALVIDMDGVLWRGDTPLPGLIEFFDFLHGRPLPYMLATNNARKTPEQYQARFKGFGVTIPREVVLTSSLATAAYLENVLEAGSPVYVLGEDGLREAVRSVGFKVLADAAEAAVAVVAGIDFTLSYDKLKYAVLHVQRGARFIGSNADLTLPTEEGFYPGAGAILAAIQAATGVKPVTIGKPERLMFDIAVQKLGSDPARTAMVGDRLETDILGAQGAGLRTIMVTTGVDDETTVAEKGINPDVIFSGIDALWREWQALG